MVAQGSQNERMKKYLKMSFCKCQLIVNRNSNTRASEQKYCVAPYLVSLWTQCSRYFSIIHRVIHRISSFRIVKKLKRKDTQEMGRALASISRSYSIYCASMLFKNDFCSKPNNHSSSFSWNFSCLYY